MFTNLTISHIAILISDLDKARAFYTDILGLEEIERPAFRIPGIWYQLGSSQLHLMLLPKMRRPESHHDNITVQPHFALSVTITEYKLILEKLFLSHIHVTEDKSVNFTTETWQAFFQDDDGNMIEIITTHS